MPTAGQGNGKEFQYSGKDNLELMTLAVNYNNSIYAWLSGAFAGGGEILEFGAGKGEFCNRIRGAHVSAVELDQDLHGQITCETFRYLSEVNRAYDVIYSLNVLEHLPDDDSVVSQFHHLLKEGGRVKILVPARRELFSKMDEKVGHLRRYTKETLRRLFTRHGFQITACRYFDCLGYFTTLLFKMIGNDDAFNEKTILLYDRIFFPVSRLIDTLTFGGLIGKNIMLDAVKIHTQREKENVTS
jgi:SAM-dependent methyltransferase